jgi:3-deoxy-manno-octulosonate cytidylyltransferase (CMP-KDO synthetase)
MAEPACGFKVVIPARYGSTRLPGKPLLPIAGKPMIQHVVERARESAAEEILVATDDWRIADVCLGFGADVVMTKVEHRSGSDRITEVIERRGWGDEVVVVNLQGDEPAMPSALIDQVASDLAGIAGLGMSTLASPIRDRATLFDPHVVKVVTDAQGNALYFSRAPLPWHRDEFLIERADLPPSVTFLRHIGLYAYRAGFLKRYLTWSPSPLELAESLEQLRVLWHGERIHVAVAETSPGPGVDIASDLAQAEKHLRPEGSTGGNPIGLPSRS